MSQADAKLCDALIEATKCADEENTDLTPHLEEQDQLRAELQSVQTSLL